MPLAPGSRLGPYEVVSSLGAGGMGEVWRARDTRLGREVAIKVLAAHLGAEPEVRARFEREARAISSLSHPHICVLHDVGRDGDTDYLVMELIEGETLARRLQRGALPLVEALRIGAQIADALDRAHRAGIVHRDLKPGNVMLAKSGAKLMDFGLARAQVDGGGPLRSRSSDLSVSPTMSRPLTAEGSIVGTFQYMAPEQLEGGEADARSDVWAFGCLLYEMIAGRPAFSGRSAASLIGSILKDEPPPLASSTSGPAGDLPPPQLDHLVRRCLAKDPEDRWQSAADLKHELQWMSGVSGASASAAAVAAAASSPAPRRRWNSPHALVALAAAVVAGFAVVALPRLGNSGRDAPLLRFDVPEIPGMQLAEVAEPALSPDGTKLVFAGIDSMQIAHLYLRDLASTEVREVAGTDGAKLPFWSPDGKWIGFFAHANLLKVALEGGAPVTIAPAPDARGGAWSPRRVIVFAPSPEGVIDRVSPDGGEVRAITTLNRAAGERSQRYPCFLPDGRHFLYVAVRANSPHPWYLGDIDGRPARLVGRGDTAPVWSSAGYVLWNDQLRVLAQRFDPRSARTSGEPRVIGIDAFRDNFGFPNLAVAGNGLLFLQRFHPGAARLFWRSEDGHESAVPVEPLPVASDVSMSHDRRKIVYNSIQDGAVDLWLKELGGGAPVRLTNAGAYATCLTWSRDDRRLLYSRATGRGGYDVRMLDFASGSDTLLMRPSGTFAFGTWWSPDDRTAFVCSTDSTGAADLWIAPTDGSGPPRLWRHTPNDEEGAILSPDGKWLVTDESAGGKEFLAIQPFAGVGPRVEMPVPLTVNTLGFSPSGRELRFTDVSGTVRAVPVDWGPPARFGVARSIGQQGAQLTVFAPPGEHGELLVTRHEDTSRLSLLEGVLNWPKAIEGR